MPGARKIKMKEHQTLWPSPGTLTRLVSVMIVYVVGWDEQFLVIKHFAKHERMFKHQKN